MAIDVKLIDKLLADYKKPEDIIGEILEEERPQLHWNFKVLISITGLAGLFMTWLQGVQTVLVGRRAHSIRKLLR